MKKSLFKIASISLAFLVLFSTLSFTVEKHYCGDFLVDIAYMGHADGCGMEMGTPSKTTKKNCCKNEIHEIEGQDELQQSVDDAAVLKGQSDFISSSNTSNDLFQEIPTKEFNFIDFSPPDISLNYQVLYQSFLI